MCFGGQQNLTVTTAIKRHQAIAGYAVVSSKYSHLSKKLQDVHGSYGSASNGRSTRQKQDMILLKKRMEGGCLFGNFDS